MIRADVDKKFIRRFLYIAIGCFLFMLWGLYDGLYTSPEELQRAIEYKKLVDRQEKGEISEAERATIWKEMAEENKWREGIAKPKEPNVAQNYVYFQWFVFATGLLLGIFFLVKYMRLRQSWMEADDSGLTTSWGESLKFEKITKIDKRKWEKKGIARVEYSDDSGSSRTMIFDDFKFDRGSMGKIMSLAEQNLADEQITGGPRQSEKDASTDEKPQSAVSSQDID